MFGRVLADTVAVSGHEPVAQTVLERHLAVVHIVGPDTGVAAQRGFRRCLGGRLAALIAVGGFLFLLLVRLGRLGQALVSGLCGGEGFVGEFDQAFQLGFPVLIGSEGEPLLLQPGEQLLRPGAAGGSLLFGFQFLDAFLQLGDLGLELPVFLDRKSTRLNSSHATLSRMPSSA